MKSYGLAIAIQLKLLVWSMRKVGGMRSVGVKCVEIERNTHREGTLLELT